MIIILIISQFLFDAIVHLMTMRSPNKGAEVAACTSPRQPIHLYSGQRSLAHSEQYPNLFINIIPARHYLPRIRLPPSFGCG